MSRAALLLTLLVTLAAGSAWARADSIQDVGVLIQWGSHSWDSADNPGSLSMTSNGDGTFDVKFYGWVPGAWSAIWNATVDPDPFISGVFSLTNLGPSADQFTVVVDLPGVSMPSPTTMSGSLSATVLDSSGGDGATLSAPAAGSIYTAMIDASTIREMANSPFSVAAAPFATNAFGPLEFAGEAGPGVNSSLSIQHDFVLSAGDSATMTSSFFVVPEPTTLSLLAMGCFAVTLRRRRGRG